MSRGLTVVDGIAAAIPVANVDTDMLFPAAFLKTTSRKGLARALFNAQRFTADGTERPEFILNREPWRHASILVSLDNFGCGSSREHAPWALKDFGIRCIIAPSFADIFHGNCFKNGILPVTLPQQQIGTLIEDAASADTAKMRVDLEAMRISRSNGDMIAFSIDPQRRSLLLEGLDQIGLAMRREKEIAAAEAARSDQLPWMTPECDLAAFVRG